MQKTHRVVMPLRILLLLLFAALVLAQVLAVPEVVGQMVEDSPDLAHLRWPMVTVSVLGLVCVQVVVVCTWKLLTMVKDDRIFSEESLLWVDAIVWAIAAAWVLLVGLFVYFVMISGLAGVAVLLLLMVVAGAVLGLLLVVMRALLRQATTLRSDMETVI